MSYNETNGVAYGCLRTSLRQLCTYRNAEISHSLDLFTRY